MCRVCPGMGVGCGVPERHRAVLGRTGMPWVRQGWCCRHVYSPLGPQSNGLSGLGRSSEVCAELAHGGPPGRYTGPIGVGFSAAPARQGRSGPRSTRLRASKCSSHATGHVRYKARLTPSTLNGRDPEGQRGRAGRGGYGALWGGMGLQTGPGPVTSGACQAAANPPRLAHLLGDLLACQGSAAGARSGMARLFKARGARSFLVRVVLGVRRRSSLDASTRPLPTKPSKKAWPP